MSEKKNKNTASLGYLFWIAFIVLIIILFFFNKSNITNVLEKSGAKTHTSASGKSGELNGNNPAPVIPQINTKQDLIATPPVGDGSADAATPKDAGAARQDAGQTDKNANPGATTASSATASAAVPEKTASVQNKTVPAVKTETKPVEKPVEKTADKTAEKAVPAKAPAEKTPAPAKTQVAPVRTSSVYFVKIDSDGKVLQQQVSREIPKSDSPLSETLEVLFRGTSSAETGKGLRSLIPAGTKLLSATVKDGVATVNVSEEFQFNQYGIEGYLGQLAQVVYTATSYPTVKSVQFLIEGQRREYLGAEGVWIGTPLSREKF